MEFSYMEVSNEIARLGFTYASDEMFDESEITEAVASLPDYALSTVVATLKAKTATSATLQAFAKLADSLGATVTMAYEGLEITRDTSPAERRESALLNMRSAHNEANRRAARLSLERQALP